MFITLGSRVMIKKISQRFLSTQFLSLLLIKMLIPAMATGGIAIEAGLNNQLESAYIDSVTPVEASVTEAVDVCSNGIEVNNEIMDCGYLPRLAGALSTAINFKHLPLSQGANAIHFLEQACSKPEVKLPDLSFT